MKKEDLKLVTIPEEEYENLLKLKKFHDGITVLVVPEYQDRGQCYYLQGVAIKISANADIAAALPVVDLIRGMLEFSKMQSKKIEEIQKENHDVHSEVYALQQMSTFDFKVRRSGKRHSVK